MGEELSTWEQAGFWTVLAILVIFGVVITREASKNNDVDGLFRVGVGVLAFAAVLGILWAVFA